LSQQAAPKDSVLTRRPRARGERLRCGTAAWAPCAERGELLERAEGAQSSLPGRTHHARGLFAARGDLPARSHPQAYPLPR
jgi:hypothetical protein